MHQHLSLNYTPGYLKSETEEVQQNFSLFTQVSLPPSQENENTQEKALNLQIISSSAHWLGWDSVPKLFNELWVLITVFMTWGRIHMSAVECNIYILWTICYDEIKNNVCSLNTLTEKNLEHGSVNYSANYSCSNNRHWLAPHYYIFKF